MKYNDRERIYNISQSFTGEKFQKEYNKEVVQDIKNLYNRFNQIHIAKMYELVKRAG